MKVLLGKSNVNVIKGGFLMAMFDSGYTAESKGTWEYNQLFLCGYYKNIGIQWEHVTNMILIWWCGGVVAPTMGTVLKLLLYFEGLHFGFWTPLMWILNNKARVFLDRCSNGKEKDLEIPFEPFLIARVPKIHNFCYLIKPLSCYLTHHSWCSKHLITSLMKTDWLFMICLNPQHGRLQTTSKSTVLLKLFKKKTKHP